MSTMLGSLEVGTSMIGDGDAGKRATVRRQALGGALRLLRSHRRWSVQDAAAATGIAPMTWRRVEHGLDVRERTHTALDGLLGRGPGVVARALADDVLMVELVGALGVVVVDGVEDRDAAAFLATFVARLAAGGVDTRPMVRVDGMTELELATRLVESLRTGPPLTERTDALIRAALQAMPDLFGRDQPER